MFKLFKDSFRITNDCIILATPLIVFLSILGWYFSYAIHAIDTIPKLILGIITSLVMISGFVSAWLYMAKKTLAISKRVILFDKDRIKALYELVLSLPKGIGKLFLPILGAVIIYLSLYAAGATLITFIVDNYIGSSSLINLFDIDALFISSKELIEEINMLADNEQLAIVCWYASMLIFSTLISFFTVLWIPELVYTEKNPIKALYNSIIKLFTTLPKTLLLFLYIALLTVTISILNTLLMFNPFAFFLVLILYYYFLVYIIVLLFSYYEQNFI